MDNKKLISHTPQSGVGTSPNKVRWMCKLWVVIWVWILFISLCVMIIPIIKHHLEVQKIKNEIEKVQLQIEFNKEQWNVCHDNMEMWHDENEQNREILNQLMQQYNDMVGFTKASENRVSPQTQVTESADLLMTGVTLDMS